MKIFKCFFCNATSPIAKTCWHTDRDGREFAVKMRESREFGEPKIPEKKYITLPECRT